MGAEVLLDNIHNDEYEKLVLGYNELVTPDDWWNLPPLLNESWKLLVYLYLSHCSIDDIGLEVLVGALVGSDELSEGVGFVFKFFRYQEWMENCNISSWQPNYLVGNFESW